MADMTEEERKEKLQIRDPSQILGGWKEAQKREELFFMKNSKKQFIKLEKKLTEKNNYFGATKVDEINAYDNMIQKEKDIRKMKEGNKIDLNYCQKCPVYKNYCPHKNSKILIKDKYSYPIISSSTYGWLPDIDKFKENYRINHVTKNFYDSNHLS
jgi:hypothetical protein